MKTKIIAILLISLFTLPTLGQTFQKRKNFNSDEEYGDYNRSRLTIGMTVKANQDYGRVTEGMEGIFYGDLGVNPPCNIKWNSDLGSSSQVTSDYPQAYKTHAYNMEWYMVDIIGQGSSLTSTSRNTVASFNIQKEFTSNSYEEYTFYIDDISALSEIKLTINGSDFDDDNDGDFTDFFISVNGNDIIDMISLHNEGMTGNGNYSDLTYDITDYIVNGQNTIKIGNTEDDGQVDYAFIKTMKVTSARGTTIDDIVDGDAIKFIDINKQYTAGLSDNYYFNISSPSDYGSVQIIMNGSDFDYDNDGDYTDFSLYVNDEQIFYIEDLASFGMSTNGNYSDVSFDISDYLVAGSNKIFIENTETSDQVDYLMLKSITITPGNAVNYNDYDVNEESSKGKTQGFSTTQMQTIEEFDIDVKFAHQTTNGYSFYIDDIREVNEIVLVINGSDYDVDNDGDYTICTFTLNGTDIFTSEELADLGMSTDGNYSDWTLDITNNIKDGLNYLEIINIETSDETDYAFIKTITVKYK